MSDFELADLVAAIDAELAASHRAADEPAAARRAPAEDRHVVFSLADLRCAVPIRNVAEIDLVPRITPVPHVPEWVLGVTNLRGDIVSVVDLGSLCGLAAPAAEAPRRILVVRGAPGDTAACLVVDKVEGLARLSRDSIQPPRAALEERIAPVRTADSARTVGGCWRSWTWKSCSVGRLPAVRLTSGARARRRRPVMLRNWGSGRSRL